MFKKLFLTAMFCMGLMTIMGLEEAKAWPRIGGWGLSFSSVHCDALLQGIGNPEINPLWVECQLSNISMAVSCENNGGGTGGLGNPFNFEGVTANSTPITWDDFTSKGKATADVTFTDCDFYDLVQEYLADNTEVEVCQNHNWSIVEPICQDGEYVSGGKVSVLSTDVCIEIVDEDNDFYFAQGYCELNTDDPEDIHYDCTKYDSGRGTCPSAN